MDKLNKLEEILAALPNLCVFYSGGVDSAFLLAVAKRFVKGAVVGLMADTCFMSRAEVLDAQRTAEGAGLDIVFVELNPLADEKVRHNDKKRCYYCKKQVFSTLMAEAQKRGFTHFADGQNADDLSKYRPGHAAAQELEVLSPLAAARFTKADIRAYSREFGLPTWDKPANACLATRLPYDTEVTHDSLARIEAAEDILHGLGIRECRARTHGDILRVEVKREDFGKILDTPDLTENLLKLGYAYVTLDLNGISSGSMDLHLRG